LTAAAAIANSGCPELNRQPDRSGSSFFSVDDPTWRNAGTAASEATAPEPAGSTGSGE
jgi:hypothetical protein